MKDILIYNDYLKRLQKNVKTVRRIRKCIFIALLFICALISVMFSLWLFNGTIIGDVSCSDVYYGQTPEYSAKAFLNEPSFVFYREGHENEATSEVPVHAGKYVIEAVGGNGLGSWKHAVSSFEIKSIPLELKPDNSEAVYGESSNERNCISQGLINADAVSSYSFSYEYLFPDSKVTISLVIDSVTVVNEKGDDVTSDYSITAGSVTADVKKQDISIGVSDSVKNTSDTGNAILKKLSAATETKSTNTVIDGTLEIEYDGKAHSVPGFQAYTGQLYPGDYLVYEKPLDSYIEIGTYKIDPANLKVMNKDGTDRTAYYNINTQYAYLKIVPRKLVIESNSAQVYKHLLNEFTPSFSVTSGTLIPGHRLEINFSISEIPGTSFTNKFTVDIVDTVTGKSVANYYDITAIYGTCTIIRIPLTIETGSAEKVYDKQSLSCSGYKVLSGALLEGHHFFIKEYNSDVYAGIYKNDLNFSIYDNQNKNVSDYYSITVVLGYLTIHPAEIVIRSLDAEKEYDGTPLCASSFQLVSGAIYDDFFLEIVYNASRTEIGESPAEFRIGSAYYVTGSNYGKTIQYYLSDINLYNFDSNSGKMYWQKNNVYTIDTALTIADNSIKNSYKITCEYGTIKVKPCKLIITGIDARKAYDGTALTCSGYTLNIKKLPQGTRLVTEFHGTITEIGKTINDFTAYLADASGNDVSDKYFYNIEKEYGTLVINNSPSGSMVTSSQISTQSGDAEQDSTIVYYVKSDCSGYVYLKYQEFDRLDNNTWNSTYSVTYYSGKYASPYNPLGFATKSTKLHAINIYSADGKPFECLLIPNYVYIDSYFNGTFSDSFLIKGESSYSFTFFAKKSDLVSSFSENINSADAKAALKEYESNLDIYLYIQEQHRAMFDDFCKDQDFLDIFNESRSDNIASMVAKYLGKICSYSVKYPEIPSGEDPLSYFLTESHIGKCDHFATAATMMLRYFGIPARYCTGFAAYSAAGIKTAVKADQAHAWCEYYDSSTGTWVILEATAFADNLDSGASGGALGGGDSGSGSGGSGSETEDDKKTETEEKTDIKIYVRDAEKKFDGWPLVASSYLLVGELQAKHYISQITYTGSQTYVGCSYSSANVTIMDPKVGDVTSKYNITIIPGKLEVLPVTGLKIDAKNVFDIGEFSWNISELVLNMNPVFNEILEFDVSPADTEKWKVPPVLKVKDQYQTFLALLPLSKEMMTVSLSITDLNSDGIPEFSDDTYIALLNIKPYPNFKPMGMTADSAREMGIIPSAGTEYEQSLCDGTMTLLDIEMSYGERSYNGEDFKVNSAAVIGGKLKDGHTLSVSGSGVQRFVGETVNTCASVKIVDGQGNDVTNMYFVRAFENRMKVTATEYEEFLNTHSLPLLSEVYIENDLKYDRKAVIDRKLIAALPDTLVLVDNKLRSMWFGETEIVNVVYYDLNADGVADLVLSQHQPYKVYFSGFQIAAVILILILPSAIVIFRTFRKKKKETES